MSNKPTQYKVEVDEILAEKDREIALLKKRICNGDVSRLTWIDDCLDKDKEIAELKKKLMPCLNGDCILTCEVVEKYGKENAELKQKLEDAGMRERRLRRLLWHAIALFCARSCEYFNGIMSHCLMGQDDLYRRCEEKKNKYLNAVYKCRAKADEYK